MTILRCFSRIVFALFPPSIAARIAADSVVADAFSASGSTGGFPKYCGFPPMPLATNCAVFTRALASSLPKPVTALSDAGFLVVVAAGAVVAVDAGATRGIGSRRRHWTQYAVPLAYRMRFCQWQNFRQLFWETELRTVSQGHPDYRFIEQEKYRRVKDKFPLIASFMLVDTNEYAIARRGTEEQILAKEKKLIEKLQEKTRSDK